MKSTRPVPSPRALLGRALTLGGASGAQQAAHLIGGQRTIVQRRGEEHSGTTLGTQAFEILPVPGATRRDEGRAGR